MNYKKLAAAFVLLSMVGFTAQTQTSNYQLKNVTPPAAEISPARVMTTTTVYISNPTDNTYYISFYNTSTSQSYYQTVYPWTNPTLVVDAGTYDISVTYIGSAYPTWMYFVNQMSWGTTGIFPGVPLSAPWTSVGFGD